MNLFVTFKDIVKSVINKAVFDYKVYRTILKFNQQYPDSFAFKVTKLVQVNDETNVNMDGLCVVDTHGGFKSVPIIVGYSPKEKREQISFHEYCEHKLLYTQAFISLLGEFGFERVKVKSVRIQKRRVTSYTTIVTS